MRDHIDSAGHLPPPPLGTFGDDVQAMDYVQAKIESLVTLMETEDASIKHFNPEKMRFRDWSRTSGPSSTCPKREKLVDCEYGSGEEREGL